MHIWSRGERERELLQAFKSRIYPSKVQTTRCRLDVLEEIFLWCSWKRFAMQFEYVLELEGS